jgi:spoIIIJ-associated protein
MPLDDKIAAAKRIDSLLKQILPSAGFRLRYRITVDPPLPEERDWERPAILVDLSGPDADLLLERGAELLRSIETVTQEMLRLPGNEHEKVQFDCMNHRAMRIQELQMAAQVAAERVRKTGIPYQFSPMTSRERRILHLALRDASDLKTESSGEAGRRAVVVMPKDYDPARVARRPMMGRRRR